ncbi:GDSL-type esterase/lipase family protein [Glycomyces mayteni]|uniref:GDSL-type esterase/lipase family protein n=1 Tax=Glycomyces mayteni TaxID=543887 RepID=A0ABW2D6Q7_9ACTN
MRRRVLLGAGAALTGTALGGALTAAPAAAQTAAGPRAGTWGAAAYPLADVAFGAQTGRFIVRTSVAGTSPRLRLSNVGGAAPLTVGTVRFGLHAGGGAVAAGTNKAVTFGGADTVVIAAGAVVLSDPIDLDLPAEADVAVSIHVPDVVADVTGHSIAAQRSYLTADGDHAAEESAAAFTEYLSKWYLLDEITVELDGPGGTVVCLGDSITDGVGSTSNLNRRWPDYLARRLLTADANTGVLNAGVSGNRVLWDGAAPSAQARLDRDVLSHPGVHAVVLLEAINDIASGKAAAPGDLLAAYAQIRERLAVHGVRLVLGTVTPWLGSASYTDAKEDIRVAVNTAIRAGTDPFIDFEAAVRDPENPKRLRAEYDSGGGVHPSWAGYEAMAAAVDLALLAPSNPSL